METATPLPEIDRTQEIDGLAIKFYYWSRNPSVLAGLAAVDPYAQLFAGRMMDVIDLFRENGTVDELGLGTIRDAIADRLFPGTRAV